jgi:hypothetical protein
MFMKAAKTHFLVEKKSKNVDLSSDAPKKTSNSVIKSYSHFANLVYPYMTR